MSEKLTPEERIEQTTQQTLDELQAENDELRRQIEEDYVLRNESGASSEEQLVEINDLTKRVEELEAELDKSKEMAEQGELALAYQRKAYISAVVACEGKKVKENNNELYNEIVEEANACNNFKELKRLTSKYIDLNNVQARKRARTEPYVDDEKMSLGSPDFDKRVHQNYLRRMGVEV